MVKKPFSMFFDLNTGDTDKNKVTSRYLSNMKDMYFDISEAEKIIANKDEKIYDFTELGFDEVEQDLLFGTSIVYPGKVGNEYYMTKGHFHTKLDLAEMYYCLSGKGYMLMETPEGEWEAVELEAGKAVYVPGRWAHRSINVGDEPLVTFFVFRADAGHDYGTIETKGYRKLIVERDGKPTIIDNPKWK
ncbi:MAG: glucose-6-phosphate isomerase [Vallitalea sp.]|jgi:glucose-6-phosphate isomerase|nr:glucose-6-phosphate isomerase [Vallitalea sp.]